jgi:F0F1-type ATP synthase gamma subunit
LYYQQLKTIKVSIKGTKGKDFVIDQKYSLSMKLSMLFDGHTMQKIAEISIGTIQR